MHLQILSVWDCRRRWVCGFVRKMFEGLLVQTIGARTLSASQQHQQNTPTLFRVFFLASL
jgi:hypothetical protein